MQIECECVLAEPGGADPLLAAAVDLHRDFQSLGLFADYGDMCLVMALALARIFEHLEVEAKVRYCNLIIASECGAFLLGFEEPGAKIPPDLIDSHAVCVADDRLLLDFGLGQARKALNVPIYESAIAPYTPQSPVLATHFAGLSAYVWLDQPRHNPRVRAVTDANRSLAGTIFGRWLEARNAPRRQSVRALHSASPRRGQ